MCIRDSNSGTLNIEQDADESGSLIAKSASTPTITLKKYLVGSQWTLIGIPVTGEVVNDIDDNLATNSGKVQLDIGTMTKLAELDG